jgi:hypothetical protein
MDYGSQEDEYNEIKSDCNYLNRFHDEFLSLGFLYSSMLPLFTVTSNGFLPLVSQGFFLASKRRE